MSNQFRDRAKGLRQRAEELAVLATNPSQVTPAVLMAIATLMSEAARDLDDCTCARAKDDGYEHIYYAENCREHHSLYHARKSLENAKEHYHQTEKTLTNEVRLNFVRTALAGTAELPLYPAGLSKLVEQAFCVADEAIRQLTQGSKP